MSKKLKKEKDPDFRIPLAFDPCFKRMFYDERTKDTVLNVISKISKMPLDNVILPNSELPVEKVKEKLKRGDMILETEKCILSIEMNLFYKSYINDRNFTYLSKIRALSYQRGETYADSKIIIQLNFNDYEKDSSLIDEYAMISKVDGEEFIDTFRIYAISLPKAREMYYNGDRSFLIKFLTIISLTSAKKIKEVSKGDERLMALNELSEELNQGIDFNNFWDYEEEAKKERATCYSEGKKEGIEKGREEGREEGIEQGMQQEKVKIAKELLKQNVDISIIEKTTGLTEEKIKKL